MFGQNDAQDQQQTQNDQSNFTAPGMAPIIAPASPTPSDGDTSFGTPLAPSSPSLPAVTTSTTATSDDDLLAIKQDALQQLSPLVGHLEQTPEEKFRTTMMMIQASDDQTLVKAAYEAAKEITDEKARAQALLDIINEINYFTQQHKG